MPSIYVDVKGWKVEEVDVCRCDSVVIGHCHGNGGSGNLVVGVGRLDRHVVTGTASVYDEVEMEMVLMVGYGVVD